MSRLLAQFILVQARPSWLERFDGRDADSIQVMPIRAVSPSIEAEDDRDEYGVGLYLRLIAGA